MQGMAVDEQREVIFEAQGGQLWVLQPRPREVVQSVDLALLAGDGRLLGYDPVTDHLYFLVDGQLEVVPASSILGQG
jgi:hypothetical protein